MFNFSDKKITDKYVGNDPLGFKHDALIKSVRTGSLDLTNNIDSFTRDRWKKDFEKNGRIDPLGEALSGGLLSGDRSKSEECGSSFFGIAAGLGAAAQTSSRSTGVQLQRTNSAVDAINNSDDPYSYDEYNDDIYEETYTQETPVYQYHPSEYIKSIDIHQLFPYDLAKRPELYFDRCEKDDLEYK